MERSVLNLEWEKRVGVTDGDSGDDGRDEQACNVNMN